jgi:hypothetical protein
VHPRSPLVDGRLGAAPATGRQTEGMHANIVEGEPGIFPDPVARVLRAIGGLFGGRRRAARDQPPADQPPADPPPAAEDEGQA